MRADKGQRQPAPSMAHCAPFGSETCHVQARKWPMVRCPGCCPAGVSNLWSLASVLFFTTARGQWSSIRYSLHVT